MVQGVDFQSLIRVQSRFLWPLGAFAVSWMMCLADAIRRHDPGSETSKLPKGIDGRG